MVLHDCPQFHSASLCCEVDPVEARFADYGPRPNQVFSSALTALNPSSAMASSWLSARALKRWRSCWGLTFLEAGLTCVYGPCRYCGPRLSHGFLGGITPESFSATGRGVCVCTKLLPLLGFLAAVLRDRTRSSRQRFPLRQDADFGRSGICRYDTFRDTAGKMRGS